MAARRDAIVRGYVRMWPRSVFHIKKGKKLLLKELGSGLKDLDKPGVYVLFRNEQPYYVGKAGKLARRIDFHANKSTGRYYLFWNFFSAFIVPREHLDEVEAILIAAMPTANSANPRFREIRLPQRFRDILNEARTMGASSPRRTATKGASR